MAAMSEPRACSIAAALDVVGERWSLLVVRELSLGVCRFQEIQRNTGAPRDILTARLRKLEAQGIIERRLYQERPPRHEYVLTSAGRALSPVLLTLRAWGDRFRARELFGGPPSTVTHTCGERFEPLIACRACRQPVRGGELRREAREGQERQDGVDKP
jgi:DNA-binding HxlR family transcriptional regulator